MDEWDEWWLDDGYHGKYCDEYVVVVKMTMKMVVLTLMPPEPINSYVIYDVEVIKMRMGTTGSHYDFIWERSET